MPDLEQFIEKLLEMKSDRDDRPFSQEELHQIALDMGLTEEDWNAIQAKSDAHATTGRGFLEYENYEDAVAKLEQALTLNLSRTDILFDLAMAYQGRYKEGGLEGDKAKALEHAYRLLDVEPGHDGALRLISNLRKKPDSTVENTGSMESIDKPIASALGENTGSMGYISSLVASALENTGSMESIDKPVTSELGESTRLMDIIGMFVALAILAAVLFGIFVKDKTPQSDPPATVQPAEESAEVKSTAEPASTWILDKITEENKSSKLITDGLDVPVRFMLNDKAKGLDFEVESSVFQKFPKAWSYTLKATMPVAGFEFDRVKMKIELIDADGNVIVADQKDAWEIYMPSLRPGDVAPMDYLEYNDSGSIPKLSEIRVSVDSVQRRPKAESYPVGEPVRFEWPDRPAELNIEIRSRRMNIGTGAIIDTDKLRHELVLEVKNTGQTVIRLLKLRLDYFDKKEKKRFSKDKLVTIDSYPHIRPGRTRVGLFLAIIPNMSPDEYGWYDITVVEAK